ncbi:hypothetical protein AALB19_10505 [Oscillospiraceae bacterium 50-58]
MINPLVSITATLYFEVKNALIFGGEGSVGYTSAAFADVQNIENLTEDFISGQKKITAKILGVSVDDISLISKDAYEAATNDPDDPDDPEDWEE